MNVSLINNHSLLFVIVFCKNFCTILVIFWIFGSSGQFASSCKFMWVPVDRLIVYRGANRLIVYHGVGCTTSNHLEEALYVEQIANNVYSIEFFVCGLVAYRRLDYQDAGPVLVLTLPSLFLSRSFSLSLSLSLSLPCCFWPVTVSRLLAGCCGLCL